jgi:hypothetical protein
MATNESTASSLRKRLEDLEAELAHVRRLLAELGLDTAASAAGEPAISGRWRPLYYLLAERGGDVHMHEMIALAERNGFGFDAEAIRKQLETWSDQGLVRASGRSTFRLTEFVEEEVQGADPARG